MLGAHELTNAALWLSRENGYLENLQVLFIVIALLTCIWAAAIHNGADRTVPWVLAAACCVCLVREIDSRTFGGPAWIASLTSGEVGKIWYAALLAMTTAYVIKRREDLYVIVPNLFDVWWWPLYASAMLISFGQTLDQWPGMFPFERTVEETAELIAYALLVFATIRIFRDGLPHSFDERCQARSACDNSLK